MINQYVIDSRNVVYIGIKNVDNRFCYYIAAIQRLHSSQSLSQALKSIPDPKYVIILKPLEIYSRIRIDPKYHINNTQEIYNQLETQLITTTNNLSDKLQHGGNPDHVLITLFLPAIYKMYGLTIAKNVIHELYINPNRLNFLLYDNARIHDFELTKNDTLNKELEASFEELQKALRNEPLSNGKFEFRVSTMSIMFKDIYGSQSNYNGHAINLVKGVNDEGRPDLYVIDDSVGISPLQIFLDRHKNRIGYWEIKDATDELLQEIGRIPEIDIDKRLHRDVLNVKSSPGMSGGDVNSEKLNEESDAIKKYEEEIVNECAWSPFVSVRDVKLGPKSERQEIYGIIGGTINSNSNSQFQSSMEGGASHDSQNSSEEKMEEPSSDSIQTLDQTDDSLKENWRARLTREYHEFTINKYLTFAIIGLIIIIIITLTSRRKKTEKTRKRIETYIEKIKDTRKKNAELAVSIYKAKQVMEQPKKEVAAILHSGNKEATISPLKSKEPFVSKFGMLKNQFSSPLSRHMNYSFSLN